MNDERMNDKRMNDERMNWWMTNWWMTNTHAPGCALSESQSTGSTFPSDVPTYFCLREPFRYRRKQEKAFQLLFSIYENHIWRTNLNNSTAVPNCLGAGRITQCKQIQEQLAPRVNARSRTKYCITGRKYRIVQPWKVTEFPHKSESKTGIWARN